MNGFLLQKVTLTDLGKLQQLGKITFAQTFAAHNSEENLRAYLETRFSEKKLRSELANPYSEFYFATHNGNVIGYLKVNCGSSQTELKDENSLEIERIYVLKTFHGKQVGQKLFQKAMEIAEQKKLDYVWLGVWENNLPAIRFYEKNGFVQFDTHVFKMGHDEQTDIMMKLKIQY